MNLSQTLASLTCTNPLLLQAIRVQNEQVARDSILLINPGILGPSYYSGTFTQGGPLQNMNDDIDSAILARLTDGNGHSANYYFHGVPIQALQQNRVGVTPPPNALTRLPTVATQYIQLLNNLVNGMIANGLGFQFAFQTWTPMGQPLNNLPSTGNGTPLKVFYDLPGTPTNTYTFLLPANPAPPGPPTSPPATLCQNPVGRFKVVIRGMKQLQVLNGRWTATALNFTPDGESAGYYVNVRRRAANYLLDDVGSWDGNGYLAPLVFSVIQPSPAPPIVSLGAPGISGVELTSKKVGRPFAQQRGRRRNQVT